MSLKNLDFIKKYLRTSTNVTKEYKHDLINQLNEKYKNKHELQNTKNVIKYIKKAKATGLPYHTKRMDGSIDLLKLYLGTSSSNLGFIMVKTRLMNIGRYSQLSSNKPNNSSSVPIPIPKRKRGVKRKLNFN
jgi:hypothetical protein